MLQIIACTPTHAVDGGLMRSKENSQLIVVDGAQPASPSTHGAAPAPHFRARNWHRRCATTPGTRSYRPINRCGWRRPNIQRRSSPLLRGAEKPRELDRQILTVGPRGPALSIEFKSHAMNVQSTTRRTTLSINAHVQDKRCTCIATAGDKGIAKDAAAVSRHERRSVRAR